MFWWSSGRSPYTCTSTQVQVSRPPLRIKINISRLHVGLDMPSAITSGYSTNSALLLTNDLLYQSQYFPWLGMSVQLQFRIQQLSVDRHFEAPTLRRHKRDRFDHMLIILQYFICQAHGPTSVVSDCAIYDLYFQHPSSSGMQEQAPAILDSKLSDSKLLRDYIIEITLAKTPSQFHPPVWI